MIALLTGVDFYLFGFDLLVKNSPQTIPVARLGSSGE